MGYCTAEDVQVLLGKDKAFNDTDDTRPSLTQVNSIIDQIAAEMDQGLSANGIDLPIMDSTQLAQLKLYNSYGATCLVGNSYFRNATNVNNSMPQFYCDWYANFIKNIENIADQFGATKTSDILDNQVTDGTNTFEETTEQWYDKD